MNMDQELKAKLEQQEIKIDAIYKSVEKTRRYFLIMTWVTILAIIVPLIGLAFVIPTFLSSYSSSLNGLGI